MITTRAQTMLAMMLVVAAAACSTVVETTATSSGGHGGTGGAGTGGTGTGGTGTGGISTGGAGTGGTGGAGLPPCEIEGEYDTPVEPFQCTLPSPCPEAHFYFGIEPGSGMQGPPHFKDPAAATCILEKLRDREISVLRFTSNPEWDNIGQYTYHETIFILDTEHGASNSKKWSDLSYKDGRKDRQILKPASFFDACLSETDPIKIYECIEGWSAGCADVDVPCPVK